MTEVVNKKIEIDPVTALRFEKYRSKICKK